MDKALVQDAEYHIGREDRRQDQYPLPSQRILEHLRGALETTGDHGGHARLAFEILDRVLGLAKRRTGRQIERDGYARLLALMIDLQRPDRVDKVRDCR